MSEPGKAVFLSYASQDAEAVRRIAEALRAAGVEVWFDQSELVGGDAWDQKIRGQISSCGLFLPVISANTQARLEGYFRLEWKLAAQRTHTMADEKAFLLPIVIDGTRDTEAKTPPEFKAVQWTRLPGGETTPAFAARVQQLLAGEMEAGRPVPAERNERAAARTISKWWWLAPIFGMTMALALVFKEREHPPEPTRAVTLPAPAPVAAPAKFSEARQLAEKAAAMSYLKYDSTPDDFAAGEGLLKKALALDENDAEIWAISSRFNTNIRTRGFDSAPSRRQQAKRDAERALKLDPASINGLFALGRTQRDTDPAAAEATYRRILAREPNHAETLSNLAYLCDFGGRFEEAEALYKRVQELAPQEAPLTSYLQFLLYFHYARFEQADAAIRASIAATPSANSVAGRAMLLLTWKGDAEEAGRVIESAPEKLRHETRLIWVGAMTHLARRQPADALTVLARTEADYLQDNWYAGPKDWFTGLAQELAGRPEAARIAWQAALAVVDERLAKTPDQGALHLARGQLLARLGQPAEARREARVLEEMRASSGLLPLWVHSPALIYAALGDADAALPLLERLLGINGKDNPGWPFTRPLLRIDPRWDKLRGDPRFQKLLAEEPSDAKSVAVLAFANLSDDKANEYFSDGISEELLNVLAKIPDLKVSARTSAFSFKGKEVAIPEIARQLGVAYVVEGSVRRQGDKVRITAQLIKAADGFHVWSDTFTRDLKDIFAVQDEIAGLIAQNLSLKLGMASSAPGRSVDPEAYRLMLLGRGLLYRGTSNDVEQALGYLEQAVARDEKFALGWAWLSTVRWVQAASGSRPIESGFRAAREAAEKAMALAPDLPEANGAIGDVYYGYDWDWARAKAAFDRALVLAPGDVGAISRLSRLAVTLGQNDEAVRLGRKAVALDPLSGLAQYVLSTALLQAGRYSELEKQTKDFRQVSPAMTKQEVFALVLLGKNEEALQAAGQFKSDNNRTFALALAHWACGHRAEAAAGLARLKSEYAATAAYQIAELHAYRGETEEAFAWLEASYRQRDTGMIYLKNDPWLKTLHADPRWPVLLRKMNLADDQLK